MSTFIFSSKEIISFLPEELPLIPNMPTAERLSIPLDSLTQNTLCGPRHVFIYVISPITSP